MKNIFKKAAVSVATLGLVVSAFGATNYVEAAGPTITGGSLSMTPSTVGVEAFSAVTLDGATKYSYSKINNFTVSDSTGSGLGWHVKVKADQFKLVGGTDTDSSKLPLHSLSLESLATVTAQDTESMDPAGNINKLSGFIDSSDGVEILSAPVDEGMGTYDVSFAEESLKLTLLPKHVKAGTYESTITVSITSGP